MPSRPECLHCPLLGSELTCPAIRGNTRYCVKVDPESGEYHPKMAASVVAMASGKTLGASMPQPDPDRPNAVEGLLLVWECDYRGKPTCGCQSKVMCGLKSRTIDYRDCFECVKTLEGDERVALPDRAPLLTAPTPEPSSSGCGS